jgi:hypothetical protein
LNVSNPLTASFLKSERFYVWKKFAMILRQKKDKMIALIDRRKQSSVPAEAFA